LYAHRVGGPLLSWLSILTVASAALVLWTGWNGHGRIAAFVALLSCVGGPLAEAALPALARRSGTEAEARDGDRPYANTRRLFTRRAFGVDAIDSTVIAGEPIRLQARAFDGVPVWDPAALLRSVPAPFEGVDSAAVAWRLSGSGVQAVVIVQSAAAADAWSTASLDAASTDERGRVLPAIPAAGEVAVPAGWDHLIAYPGAVGARIIADTSGRVPAPRFSTLRERIGLAWHARAPGLLAGEQPVRARLAFRRDVRERVAAITPFLSVGPTVVPVLRGDSLYWVAELYTTSATYPLSDHLFFAGSTRSYVHHAATALVHAATGKVTIVADAAPDAIMRTWMHRFPGIFTSTSQLPSALLDARPPAVDWAAVQATAVANTGLGPGAGASRAVLGTDNADADAAGGPRTLIALPGPVPRLGWTVPLVDASGTVTGAVVAAGGARQSTTWVGAVRSMRWSDVLDRLQRAADSAGVGNQRRGARRGRVLTIPTSDGLAYVQAHYEWGSGAPALVGVSALVAGEARAGASLGEATGGGGGRPRPAGAFRSAVDELYRRMGEAMRRGDWSAFGAAFSALGHLLRGVGR
jgi:hypothetical protein